MLGTGEMLQGGDGGQPDAFAGHDDISRVAVRAHGNPVRAGLDPNVLGQRGAP